MRVAYWLQWTIWADKYKIADYSERQGERTESFTDYSERKSMVKLLSLAVLFTVNVLRCTSHFSHVKSQIAKSRLLTTVNPALITVNVSLILVNDAE